MTVAIGKIVKSNTHVDYVCQVYGRGESAAPPQPADYQFGAFAGIELEEDGSQLVGVIYNTLLLNPDFGNLGPRLSPRQELEVFTPDYLAETATLVGVFALGWIDSDGATHQGVPPLAAAVNSPVTLLAEADLVAFHQDRDGQLSLRYVPLLLGQNNPLAPPLVLSIMDRLAELFPAQRSRLAVMRNNIAWKSIVQPVG